MNRAICFALLAFSLVAIGSVAKAQPQRVMPSPEERTAQLSKELELSEDQAVAVLQILKGADAERRELFQNFDGDRQSMMETMRTLNEKTDGRINEVLTEDQQLKYAEIRKKEMERRMQNRRRPD